MALPKTRQMVTEIALDRGLTRAQIAAATGIAVSAYSNHAKGRRHVSPDEAKAYEAFFGLPIQTLFDDDVLAYVNDWPPRRGMGSRKHDVARAHSRLVKGVDADAEYGEDYIMDVPAQTVLMQIPDSYVDQVVAFLRGLDARS
ncbi:helix-turn-helix domain-containing protein [Microbacterium testaceum]|uniref:HTH cro/C1-type domain-containing protein n=1 Tax=Microbacterium testaceum TaxID=2033 RepID=A0A2T7WC51_MICTE|nr:helix-turn-helix transcriptional regulator [Microbacterium testaceum]PVE67915.1 hypothetical protein DC432_12205 [Microbacterium testaceum]